MFLRESVQHQSIPDHHRSVWRSHRKCEDALPYSLAAQVRTQSEKAQERLGIILDDSIK